METEQEEINKYFPKERMPKSYTFQITWNILISIRREHFKTVREYREAIDYLQSEEYTKNPIYKR
jgi:hypothetical protein